MKKVYYAVIGLLLLLLLGTVLVPILFKGRIIELVKKTANANVNARINFSDDISLSIFSNFPDFTLGMKELSVVGINEFENDTLAYLKEFSASLDLMSVITGDQIKIRKVALNQLYLNMLVLKSGNANWDIAKPTADSAEVTHADTTAKFSIALKSLEILDAYVNYTDLKGATSAKLSHLNYTLQGDLTKDLAQLSMLLNIDETTISQSGVRYLNQVKTTLKAAIEADNKNAKYTFKENEIGLNELLFSFDGFLQMVNNDIVIDLKYAAAKADFKSFLSLVPGMYTKDFGSIQTSGKLGFNGFAKGTYNQNQLPAFAFNLLVENAMFKYPDLPSAANNIQINLAITNPDGNINHTSIDLSKFHVEMAGDPFDAKMLINNPVQEPKIDASLKGQINLANISKLVPLQQGVEIAGIINSDVKAQGKVSTLQQGAYENFDASGTISFSNIVYKAPDLPKQFNLRKSEIHFNPGMVRLNSFDATIGNSDMQLTGELTNFFPYLFNNGTIKGVLNFNATSIDANQFMSNSPRTAANTNPDTASLSAPQIPSDIDFTLNSKIDKLLYTNMEITNFNGQVKIAEQKLSFNKVVLQALGSDISLNGFYETTNPKKPNVSMDFGIRNLDIQKAFATFNTVKQMAPIAENTKGTMSVSFNLSTALDQKLNPDYKSLFAEGILTIPNADIEGVKVFEKLGDVLKNDKIKKPTLSNIYIKFKVQEGRVFTQPFDINLSGQKMTLSGSTGIDQSIDYTATAPVNRKDLGAINSALENMMAAANKQIGNSLKMSGLIDVGIKIGGTFSNPAISTNLEDIAKQEAASLKDQLGAELEAKKKELEAKARAEADKLKTEAEKARRDAEAKARAEADRLKTETDKARREADAKAKAEAEKAKNKAEEEAKKKLKGLFPR